MRYEAWFDEDSDGNPVAAVYASHVYESSDAAIRHARAMAAVVRAAKAEQRAEAATMRTSRDEPKKYHVANAAWQAAGERYHAAVARLERVEREVGRG